MKTKMLEIRDRMTMIPVLCIELGNADTAAGYYLLVRAGIDYPTILLVSFTKDKAVVNPYEWGDRTYQTAHSFIELNWGTIQEGDVIDIEFILGETKEKKKSERFTT